MKQITKADLEEEIEELLAYKSIYSVRPVILGVNCSLLIAAPVLFFFFLAAFLAAIFPKG